MKVTYRSVTISADSEFNEDCPLCGMEVPFGVAHECSVKESVSDDDCDCDCCEH